MKPPPTLERARELFDYDQATGVITRKITVSNALRGSEAGSICKTWGYRKIFIDGRRSFAHHVAWLLHYGEWPQGMIDHVNRVPADNRIVNLRIVTPSQNQQNRTIQSNSTSKMKGVTLHQCGKWVAQIWNEGKKENLGMFINKDDAYDAYVSAAKRLHQFNPVVTEATQ